MSDEPLPCGDRRSVRRSGCKVCTLYATSARYRAAFDVEPIPPAVGKKPCGCDDCSDDCHEPKSAKKEE